MTQSIQIGLSGLAGWKILQKSENRYKTILSRDPIITKNINHFRDKIQFSNSAETIVKDFRMLSVALGASGLHDDIGNRVFIKKVLESDLKDDRSFANRLGDKRYKQLAESFQFLGEEIAEARPQGDYISQLGLHKANKEIRKLALKIEKVVANVRTVYNQKLQAFGAAVTSSEQLEFHEQALSRRSMEELIKQPDFRDVIKGSLPVGVDWDSQPKTEQLRRILQAAKREIGVGSHKEMLDPKNIAQLAWGYAYNNFGLTTKIDRTTNAASIPNNSKRSKHNNSHELQEIATQIRNGFLRYRNYKFESTDSPSEELLSIVSQDPIIADSLRIVFGSSDPLNGDTRAGRDRHILTKIVSDLGVGFNDLITEESLDKYIEKYLSTVESNKKFVDKISLGYGKDISKATMLEIRDKFTAVHSKNIEDTAKFDLIFKDRTLAGFVKTAYDLPDDFFKKTKFDKTKEFVEILKDKYETSTFGIIFSPTNVQKHLGTVLFKQRYDDNQEVKDPLNEITTNYLEREFERRVGLGDETLRLALNAKRELGQFLNRDASDRELWFRVLGNPPLRKVFETAFGFSPALAQLDIDRQHQMFIKASNRVLGSSSFKEIGKPENAEKLIRKYLVRSQIPEVTVSNRFSTALMLFRA